MATSPSDVRAGAWAERVRALRNIPPVLRIVWDSGPRVVAATLVARAIAAIMPLALLAVSQRIIDTVISVQAGHEPPEARLWPLVALELGLAVLASVMGRAVDFFESLLADRYTRHVSIRVMEHATTLDLVSFEDPVFYDKLERARAQATDRVALIRAVGVMLQQLVTAVSLAIGVLTFSPWVLVLLVVCVLPAFLGESHFAFAGYALNFRQTPRRRQLDYLRTLGASKEAAKESKLFGLGAFFTDRYRALADGLYLENLSLARRRLAAGAALSLISTVGYYGAYAYVVLAAVRGQISIGTLAFLAGAIAGASSNIQGLFSTISGIADQALFVTDLLEFFATRPTVRSRPDAVLVPRPITRGFEFRNVTFCYPGSSRRVIDGLSLHLAPGERVALVGENGEGKTTIVKLMTRLYDPTSGEILLDGRDLREYDIADLCRNIGVIFQDFMRYDMTVADNVAMGRIEPRPDQAQLESAAQKSLADGVVAKLPAKWDQLLGRRFDGGVDLSGGEWQKVALARAYLRDSPVLVLDEPTAALDARSEFEVFERFAELTTGRMALLISHRFSTVRMCDRILVLANGRIAEDGKHLALMEQKGRYAEMFELQAASYR